MGNESRRPGRLVQRWQVSASAREDTVDPRKASGADWYKESWYKDPEELYIDYLRDPGYVDPAKPIIAEWNEIFQR